MDFRVVLICVRGVMDFVIFALFGKHVVVGDFVTGELVFRCEDVGC